MVADDAPRHSVVLAPALHSGTCPWRGFRRAAAITAGPSSDAARLASRPGDASDCFLRLVEGKYELLDTGSQRTAPSPASRRSLTTSTIASTTRSAAVRPPRPSTSRATRRRSSASSSGLRERSPDPRGDLVEVAARRNAPDAMSSS